MNIVQLIIHSLYENQFLIAIGEILGFFVTFVFYWMVARLNSIFVFGSLACLIGLLDLLLVAQLNITPVGIAYGIFAFILTAAGLIVFISTYAKKKNPY
ncbi:MAG: hypothetical protein A2748_02010 [Candidatus Wildermuthbacteria bacterium RIFCSPHIGHO2_01_FULL_45_20]|uniref:Uncharacterized protein n=1 Tax=Candidatus Wildermuthbacteria bacterium RIFCSPHIGHO2_02_FULL_45_25 TaxID=1802450 RepID=A0A1G2QYM9_9BACT|nr:MAG: hypothetical protein A2748_02010 [Candidatus Wildermuthbacteria bacterium RIFCSPHIGHO2_01_FULL_45_20]OHA65696.1 MAG: hypothetical protein A3C04_02155 [Candidatus Wildermuthbacteria bacterium RIFCSPHIGHO2_02_FULL_45_25]